MNDLEFFQELAREWQRDTVALEVSRRKAQHRLWSNRLMLAGECLFSLFGLWVTWYFAQLEAMIYTVSALVLLVAIVLSTWISLRERIPLWHWHDWSPEGVLRYRVRLCESTLRFAAWCRVSSVILVLFTAYVWVNAVFAPDSVPAYFPAMYTFVILATIAGLEWWAWRQRQLRTRELAALRTLLQTFDTPQ